MELNTALEKIKQVSNKFAEEEVLFIREHKDAAIPNLLECVRNAVDNFDEIPENIEDRDDPAYAMFLLAEFKVHKAFDPFIKMLELDEDKCDWLLGDMITEDMGSLIASVADIGDVERIKVVIENAGINEFQRFAALRSLVIMYSDGKYQRADLLDYLRHLLDEYEDDEAFVTNVVCACEDVFATEHYERIREMFNDNKIDTFVIGDEGFANDVPVMTEDKVLESLRSNSHTCIITDTVKSMRWWACFNERPYTHKPTSYNIPITKQPGISNKKIGRNEPCPCGSGKKYKKCCLNKGDEVSE